MLPVTPGKNGRHGYAVEKSRYQESFERKAMQHAKCNPAEEHRSNNGQGWACSKGWTQKEEAQADQEQPEPGFFGYPRIPGKPERLPPLCDPGDAWARRTTGGVDQA